MDNRPIGLFDSGVGGLSILSDLKKNLPQESFIFLADQINVPYGQKTKKELQKLTTAITDFLLKFNIKMLVVACNTASCYAIASLRSKFNVPIVGVVPAIKPATSITKSGKIAIMSTAATAKSPYLDKLVKQCASSFKVLKLGCPGLEEAVEVLNNAKMSELLDKYVAKIKDFDADVIILGCTHFPWLKDQIENRVGSKVSIIDSGSAVARRVNFVLKKKNIYSSIKSKDLFFTTGNPVRFSKVASALLKYKVNSQNAIISF